MMKAMTLRLMRKIASIVLLSELLESKPFVKQSECFIKYPYPDPNSSMSVKEQQRERETKVVYSRVVRLKKCKILQLVCESEIQKSDIDERLNHGV